MNKLIIISIKDLRFVTLVCLGCGTRLTLDMEVELSGPNAAFYVPNECPRCHAGYKAGVTQAVTMLQKCYRSLEGQAGAVEFTGAAARPEAG